MNVTNEFLSAIENHWALTAVGSVQIARAKQVAELRLLSSAINKQIHIDIAETSEDPEILEKVATAYEVAAVENLDSLIHLSSEEDGKRQQGLAQAGAYRAFELRRIGQLPPLDDDRIFHVLHLASLAYCGDRWNDVRRWFKEHVASTTVPSAANAEWDKRLLYKLFDCWVRLFRKDQWNDLDGVREIVAGLREDQKQYESLLLDKEKNQNLQSTALRLIALYHWAKATESLAVFMLQGEMTAIESELDQHFEAGYSASTRSGDASLSVVLKWLHAASRMMVRASIWTVAQRVNSRVTQFVGNVTKTRSLFELLPPQRVAIQEQGLLDQANRAIIVNLPTSGGKTILAQFRILQALNQFDADNGWVAYVAPTRALVSQVTRRLRRDFGPMGVNVELLTSAVEIDGLEEALLQTADGKESFHILVTTPEKLALVIRNRKIGRPLALVVVDEAHNIEDKDRGLRIELLLASIKRESPKANFLLLVPDVPNVRELADWLAPESSKTISIGTSAWLPNERIVGIFDINREGDKRGSWSLNFETLTTTPKTIQLAGKHRVGENKPLDISFSHAKSHSTTAAAMARVFSERGTSIAVARKIQDCWSMARVVANELESDVKSDPDIELVKRFLATEISKDFELINMLDHRVAVHHAGLSEETRTLIEWLTELGKIRVLCATTTIAQGINFPVSSVFLSSIHHAFARPGAETKMSKREFWNLAGRAGRISHDSVGVVGIMSGTNPIEIKRFVRDATENLVSRLVSLLQSVVNTQLGNLELVLEQDEWVDFRSYIAHLWAEKGDLDSVLAETEQVLRNTYGYNTLRSSTVATDQAKANALLDATKGYARKLSLHPENAGLAVSTGFSPEGVRAAMLGLKDLQQKLNKADWQPSSLFGRQANSVLPQLIGVMMQVPQIKNALLEIGSQGTQNKYIADIAHDWVSGKSIEDIAKKYFTSTKGEFTKSITDACRGIYRTITNYGTWGLSALSKIPTSGLDFKKLSEEEVRTINNLPAMLYHGVNTEEAVLMRMNSIPRSIALRLGDLYSVTAKTSAKYRSIQSARDFLHSLSSKDWEGVVPQGSKMTGGEYRQIWLRLSGEQW